MLKLCNFSRTSCVAFGPNNGNKKNRLVPAFSRKAPLLLRRTQNELDQNLDVGSGNLGCIGNHGCRTPVSRAGVVVPLLLQALETSIQAGPTIFLSIE